MSISQKPFGISPKGDAVTKYTLTNAHGASVSVIDFGGVVTSIIVPDKNGKLDDVNLGFDDVAVYDGKGGSMGALIGRVGNRIGGAAFDLEGTHYVLGKNNGENNLHGGPEDFSVRMWDAKTAEEKGRDVLTLTLQSPDGDQGFPGTLDVKVEYSFNDDNELGIHYYANTDKPTLVNLTNHCYFNLDGHQSGSIKDLTLQINCDCATEVKPDLIPTGKLLPSASLPYGFVTETRIGDVLAHTDNDPTMKAAGGVDFNYCAGRDRETKVIAVLRSPKTGRRMDVITDQPGVQCYTGQGLNHEGKDHVHYGPYAGVCLETQHYPDAIHHPHFESAVLRPQDTYDTFTIYRFTAE
ncbi:MAG: galactose mutarotase [Eubacteriales bacterium]|nr:galactose mutarotase [Eubacteriales bacterium]